MRKIVVLAFVFVLLSSAMGYAEKIVQCNLQVVAENSDAFKAAHATAEKKLKPAKEKLEKQKIAIGNDIKALGNTPNKAQQDAIYKRQESYMQEATAFLQLVQDSEITVRQEMDKLILTAAQQYAKNNNCTLVLDTNAVLFVDPSLTIADVTKEMTIEVNNVWKNLKK